ncbi:MAG: nucleoside-diphosphate kinase [Dehalococcoides mccartyi]|jgi:Nucleoside diphosphate kinase|uniref:Nucleoside diphosphate kinase n=5 Tax=root TaxID=1 RepID=NDK_DEHM1|nr:MULTISPECIES: nucleoside-diphosphate kinase [Dehalococcoides]Q3Z9G0.1 RecName: Full=Nucleoside diphosphate kinase; Short=NDK; Short=NDP kinase; AltName: Full=Nucleoside-2-P kinase [Dehalococcoides mccartyi 195]AAW40306.1 nucleoside diphosphate kinase [Dehalococcoides mccartyi 195]AHB13101.1 nucleoside diphosphate kinase [Dehalococcoides mccartyi GY50]AII59083.1 nucleoside diphosphate kinase [Dehalococcoides mccartyi CG4]AQU02786.1 nucleoside-diphosphate kinase [Dehalococcoides mccartyi]AQU
MERTLLLVKPDGVNRGLSGEILGRMEKLGLKMIGLRMLQMDAVLADKHYAPHRERPFFKDLVTYITSGPIVAAVFEGENAVEKMRKAMGATDPAKSEKGTVRGDLGINIEQNTVHGSDSAENAKHEISLFFSESELVNYDRR